MRSCSVNSKRLVVLPEPSLWRGAGAARGVLMGERSGLARGVANPTWDVRVGLLDRMRESMVRLGTAEKLLKVLIMVSSTPVGSSSSCTSCSSGSSSSSSSSSSFFFFWCASAPRVAVRLSGSPRSPSSMTLTSSSKMSIACLSPSFSRSTASRLMCFSWLGVRPARGVASEGGLVLTRMGNRFSGRVILRGLLGRGGGGMLDAGDSCLSLVAPSRGGSGRRSCRILSGDSSVPERTRDAGRSLGGEVFSWSSLT
ncbi:hypothetical protein VTK73DRAFT_5491 [Phialemonium thermophilum]|uniref:Uncharacterized protein n=1 Tax=Phialemonium thermophilum TaxID=223376 RepID=A0ABR3WNF8_9PEZI